jgi:hypothetical protein
MWLSFEDLSGLAEIASAPALGLGIDAAGESLRRWRTATSDGMQLNVTRRIGHAS